jgi:serine/threonine protein kinase
LTGSFITQRGLNSVNEYAAGGTLSDFLETRGNNGGGHALEPWIATSAISRKLVFRIMRELADGLKQIHDHNIPHDYLTEKNMLLSGDPENWGSDDPLVMFAVFGASSSIYLKKIDAEHVFRVMMQAASLAEDGEALAEALQDVVTEKYGRLPLASDFLKTSEDLVEIVKKLELKGSLAAAAAATPPDSDSDAPSVAGEFLIFFFFFFLS